MAGKRAVKLVTPYDVNRLLAKTINQVLRDEISPQKASNVGYLANILLRGFEQAELNDRLARLEQRVAELASSGKVKCIAQYR